MSSKPTFEEPWLEGRKGHEEKLEEGLWFSWGHQKWNGGKRKTIARQMLWAVECLQQAPVLFYLFKKSRHRPGKDSPQQQFLKSKVGRPTWKEDTPPPLWLKLSDSQNAISKVIMLFWHTPRPPHIFVLLFLSPFCFFFICITEINDLTQNYSED